LTRASQIYHDAIKALGSAAVGHGTLEAPTGTAFLDNPLCGDCVEMQVRLEGGSVVAVSHQVRGCLLCKASASLIGKCAPGSTAGEIEHIVDQVSRLLREGSPAPTGCWEEASVFTPVHGHASRYRCVELPFQALLAALRANPSGG
jgi:nitrogen fixation NifU-like protein